MAENADDVCSIAKHKKQSEDQQEKRDEEGGEILEQAADTRGHERTEVFDALAECAFDIEGLQGSGQTIAQPGFGIGDNSLIGALAVELQCGLQASGSVETLLGSVKEHEQSRNDQEKGDGQGADEGCAIGSHAGDQLLVERIKKDGQHRSPRERHQERSEDAEDQIAEQQQSAVRQNGG